MKYYKIVNWRCVMLYVMIKYKINKAEIEYRYIHIHIHIENNNRNGF